MTQKEEEEVYKADHNYLVANKNLKHKFYF